MELDNIQNGNKNPFSVPDGYFDSLPHKIMDKIAASPALEEISISNPFSVPEHYFEQLPLQIISRIEANKKQKVSIAAVFSHVLRPKYSVSLMAACLALFFCIRFFEKPV